MKSLLRIFRPPGSAPTIESLSRGRDNNFNLLRVIAASLVILTHAYGAAGRGAFEPLKAAFGMSLGSWAVDIFFVTSGFLIGKSWDTHRSAPRFFWARALRIYPALWVCTTVCVFVIGLHFTALSPHDFLRDPDTLRFLLSNTTILPWGIKAVLPGVFTGIASPVVNEPLWTLPYELKMYLALFALAWTGLLYRRAFPLLLVLVAGLLYAGSVLTGHAEAPLAEYSRFVFVYFSGTCAYLFRAHLRLHPAAFLALLGLVASALLLPDVACRTVLLVAATPYLALYLALVPGGAIRAYNRVGDYSYGLYIWGFPLQQSILASLGRPAGVAETVLWTYLAALPCAIASWHLLERHALRLAPPWLAAPRSEARKDG